MQDKTGVEDLVEVPVRLAHFEIDEPGSRGAQGTGEEGKHTEDSADDIVQTIVGYSEV